MDRCKWRKVIKEARWSGWVWVGEGFFWYRPTRFVLDERPLNGRCRCFPGLPRWPGTRKVKPIWISLKQETVSGSGISWAICKSAPRSRQITTPTPHHSVFYRPDALPAAQPTASKHWRHRALKALGEYIQRQEIAYSQFTYNYKSMARCTEAACMDRKAVVDLVRMFGGYRY